MNSAAYVIGVDFGSLSGRALVVRVQDGEELGSAEYEYPHEVIEHHLPGHREVTLPADWALQHPQDWIGVLMHAVPEAVAAAGIDPAEVIALATDFTACTVLPTDVAGTPLCADPAWSARPHAWPKLWKHHAAQAHADRITALATERGEPWIGRYGGRISSEWQFAKALQVLEDDPEVYAATARWIEAADWIVWQLTGHETRNACTAGYKGIYQDGRYPSAEYLAGLNPAFADFVETRLEHPLSELGSPAGHLTEQAAQWTGLTPGIFVATGNVDAHVSAPAADAVDSGQMLAVMGTSTCHVMSGDELADVPGMCGVVDGGIVAGKYGYEAGQSGVGDIFAWWVRECVPDAYLAEAARRELTIHQYLTDLADTAPVGAHGLIALDWLNGNRSVLVDHSLSGTIVGLTLATRPEEIYRALLEATAFGTRRIIDALVDSGVPVTEFVAAGGLIKNATLMQLYADVLGRPVSIAVSAQGPALGSAIHAAVAVGAYPDVLTAAKAMGRKIVDAYRPDAQHHQAYDELYAEYLRLHDYFGLPEARGGNEVMHRLRDIRNRALQSAAASGEGAQQHPAPERMAEPAGGHGVTTLDVGQARTELVGLHRELVRNGLVAWTSGNVSCRAVDPSGAEVMVIKPSGVAYDDLVAESMIVCDLDGQVLDGRFAPSSDTAAHAYVYRRRPDVGGVVHTHSSYACAWAARGQEIPCVLTATADEFGGPIPIGPFAIIGDDSIGQGIVATLAGHRSRAVLMANHGVFTIGRDGRDAVKAAVMCEDVAKSTQLACALGTPTPLPQDAVDALYARYQNVYGQHETASSER